MTDKYEALRAAIDYVVFMDNGYSYGPLQWAEDANPVVIRALLAERDALAVQAQRMRDALDAIYNHSEASRHAVIQCYGLHHNPLVAALGIGAKEQTE